MGTVMNAVYNQLSDANRNIVDNLVEFLFARQKKNEKETLDAIRDADAGRTIGPFNSIDDLTKALDAED